MTELEIIKAFAELEGLELGPSVKGSSLLIVNRNGGYYEWYNPIKDWSLAFKAASDYEVSTQHCTQFDCGIDGSGSYDIPYLLATTEAPYEASAATPLGDTRTEAKARAIIECILKSRGLWRD